jgi:hypothetical protein
MTGMARAAFAVPLDMGSQMLNLGAGIFEPHVCTRTGLGVNWGLKI